MRLVGRDGELAAMVAAIVETPTRGLVAVVVTGEGGIGKSRLMDAALDDLAAADWIVLRGRADLLERRIPYAALARVVARLVNDRSNDVAAKASDLAASLDLLGGRAVADIEASLGQVCSALTELLRALAERGPVALAIDDIDALDDDTLAVLFIVARRLAGRAFALLGTSRTEPETDANRFGALVNLFETEGTLAHLRLAALDEHAIGEIVAEVLDAAPDADLIREVHRRTDGNPFFAVEIASSLREAGIVDHGARRGARLTRPMLLTRGEAVLRRLLPLDPTARSVLDGIAVLGRARTADLILVADATGVEMSDVCRTFDDLIARGILVRDDDANAYAFTHDLVRDAIYEAIGPARQQLLHDAIARRLRKDRAAGRPADLLALARHVSASARPGDADAAAVLAEAGDLSRGVAPGSAAALYERALELAPESHPARPSMMARQCRALSLASLPSDAAAVGRSALNVLPPGSERARTANIVISALIDVGRLPEALAIADTEVGIGSTSPVIVAQRASVLWNLHRFDEALVEGARADALPASSPAERLLTLGPLGLLAGYARIPRSVPEVAAEMLALGSSLPGTLELYSTAIASYLLSTSGYLRSALDPLSRAEVLVDQVGGTAFRANILVSRAFADYLQGRWDEALEAIDRVAVDMDDAELAVQAAALQAIAIEIRSWRGEQELEVLLSTQSEPAPNFADLRSWAIAGGLAAAGRLADARIALTRDSERNQLEIAYRPVLISRRIDVELADGRDDVAADLLEDLQHDSQLRDNPWGLALFLRSRALVRRDIAAAERAVEFATDEGLIFEAAQSQLTAAELSESARVDLEQAYCTFQSLGADGLRRRAGALLKARGLKVPRQRSTAVGPLSEAEMKIARLVQQGMRNREIANVLHYSPRTIEVYLSRIYAKLGVSSRLELARALDAGQLNV